MPFEPIRAAASSTQGRVKTIATLYLRLLETLGCDIGRKITDPLTGEVTHPSEPLETRSAANVLGSAPPLYTGISRLQVQGSHDLEGQLEISGSGPYPCTVLSLNATGDVGEMPGQDERRLRCHHDRRRGPGLCLPWVHSPAAQAQTDQAAITRQLASSNTMILQGRALQAENEAKARADIQARETSRKLGATKAAYGAAGCRCRQRHPLGCSG